MLSPALRGSKPSFVLFNVDDTGYGDWSWNSDSDVDEDNTPRTAELRKRGLRLTDFHAGSSVCTPSRAALMTGRLGVRTGVYENFNPYSLAGLPLNETTVAEVLRGVGYRCAMAGKWHLGHVAPYGPMDRGFESWLGTPMSHDYGCTESPGYDRACPARRLDVCGEASSEADGCSCHIGHNNPWSVSIPLYRDHDIVEQPTDLNKMASRYVAFATSFIRSTLGRAAADPAGGTAPRMSAAAAGGAPFFLYVSWNHMHVPVGNHVRKFANLSERGPYGDTLRQLDDAIGGVVGAVSDAGLDNGTLLLLTGDNGGGDSQCPYAGSNLPFRGAWQAAHGGGGGTGKTTTWEGGHRMPGLVVWQGVVAAGGSSGALLSHMDVLPTFAALAAAPLPRRRAFDGIDASAVLFDGASEVRGSLAHPNSGCEGKPGALETIRVGQLKVKHRSGGGCADGRGRAGPPTLHTPPLIFDLAADPHEAHNLPSHDARRAPTEAAAAAALADLRRSIAADATSAVDWNEAPVARLSMCCDATHQLCSCTADRRFRYGDALVPRRVAAAAASTDTDELRMRLRRLVHNRTERAEHALPPEWKRDWNLDGAMRYLPTGCW